MGRGCISADCYCMYIWTRRMYCLQQYVHATEHEIRVSDAQGENPNTLAFFCNQRTFLQNQQNQHFDGIGIDLFANTTVHAHKPIYVMQAAPANDKNTAILTLALTQYTLWCLHFTLVVCMRRFSSCFRNRCYFMSENIANKIYFY